jgi:hypothetical protein
MRPLPLYTPSFHADVGFMQLFSGESLYYGTAWYNLFWCVAHVFGVMVQAGVLEELQVNLATAAQYLMDCRTAPGLYVARVSRSTCPLALYKDMNTSTFHHNINFQHADTLLLMAPEQDTE